MFVLIGVCAFVYMCVCVCVIFVACDSMHDAFWQRSELQQFEWDLAVELEQSEQS